MGKSIEVDLPGALLRLLHPFDESAPAKLTYQFDLTGLSPAEALKVLRLRRRLSLGGDFRVMIDGHLAGAGRLPKSGTAGDLRRWAQLQLFLEVLQVADQVAVIGDGAGAETMTTMSSESACRRGRMWPSRKVMVVEPPLAMSGRNGAYAGARPIRPPGMRTWGIEAWKGNSAEVGVPKGLGGEGNPVSDSLKVWARGCTASTAPGM
ncbi:hypothetical protein [Streptomyces tanashiensis]|uniref:Uncharacterized protein n=1 Tax=Streptomyces tanashiensis TaxID=67367 RepID=A0ABY6R794_9ACTN|nr:hypothetical protein [Streptomyces tanashiensis]UZX25596.1 hypothetical protein LDH80_35030 [Streptomyces tanashiensis]GGY11420.1 hypothetical protein GCM10010299_14440 [Streptomyces tanashiensis]